MLVASCHCSAVRLEVERLPEYLNECHCSICRRYAVRWGYYRPDEVRLVGEPGAFEAYCRGERTIAFFRCRTCGCVTHWAETAGGGSRMGVNGRLFEPADVAGVAVRRSAGPPSQSGPPSARPD